MSLVLNQLVNSSAGEGKKPLHRRSPTIFKLEAKNLLCLP